MDNGKGRTKDYAFDSVFGPDSTQEQLFDDVGLVVKSAIEGFNVAIWAYGQTGSGKSYTLHGSQENPGLIARSIVEMFDVLSSQK